MSLADADYETLDVEVGERAERVATVTISRPDARNALSATVRPELKDAVSAADRQERLNAFFEGREPEFRGE